MFDSFKLWQSDGTWQKIPDTFREATRIQAGREPTPSAGSIDDGVAALTVLEEMKPEEFPRLSKDVEKTISSSQAMIQIAGIQTLLHRLAPNCTKNKCDKNKNAQFAGFYGKFFADSF